MKKLLRFLLIGSLLAVMASPTQAVTADKHEPWSLPVLMHGLGLIETSSRAFTEVKELAILEISLSTQGTLQFHSPDKLIKRISTPEASSFEIDGDTLTIKSAGNPDQVIALNDNPQLRAFTESIRAVLAGDLPALQHYFSTRLDGAADSWTLQLIPKDDRLARQLEQIEVHGKQYEIQQFVVLETAGDKTTTTLEAIHD